MATERKHVVLENVRLLFLNFEGKEGPYNRKGDRNFNVLLTPEMADGLRQDGWNVKTTREREDNDGDKMGGDPIIQVSVSYKVAPPRVVMITSRGKTELTEDVVELLDHAEITHADVIINPYDWDVNGAQGRKAYLKSLFVTIQEDELDLKYADVPMAGHGGDPND